MLFWVFLLSVIARLWVGHRSVEKTECDRGYNEEKVLFLRIV